MVIIKRFHKEISPREQGFNNKKDDCRTSDPSAYYGSLSHIYQGRKKDILAKELREDGIIFDQIAHNFQAIRTPS
ncbi:MAG: hypothetical protein BWY45_02436 [Euryarchaeota archaeon ADurb.Bin294]|jgi:hypothetical protein|nr:MAG: hypothetical protein BWY45_02436 [Euryarchaeota archaeon ADurb.Bin294]